MGAIEFWFEFSSTCSYPATMRIEALAGSVGHTAEWTPFPSGPFLHLQQGLTESQINAFPVRCKDTRRGLARGALIPDPGVIAHCIESGGHQSAPVSAWSGSDKIRAELKANTGKAIRRCVFGSPTFSAGDGEMFWGNDRLEDAIAWQDVPRKVMSIGGPK